jgi:SRSO17 transposase
LYLPEDWVDDSERCKTAGVPEVNRVFHTKHELAFQLVLEARKQGVEFSWVGADGFYGEDPWFLRSLDEVNEIFMVDVHKDQHIYLENPEPIVLERKSPTSS